MNHARFHQAGFGPFEGLLGVAPHQARLAALYDPDTVFSPTQLEEYAYCPFRYFVQRVLQVEELPRFEVATDRQARGELVHSILAQLYRGLLEETAGDAFKYSRAELERRFLELALQRLSSRPHAGPQVGIARADERLLRELAVEFGRQHESYLQTVGKLLKASPRPALLEAAFGPNRTRAGQPSPSSCGPLVLGTGSRAVKIHGRIDRVDLVEAGPVPSCLVIDYKTGSPYRFNSEEVSTGRALQLVMYGLAVERLKLAGGPVRVAQLGLWHVTGAGFVPGLKSRKRGPLSQIEPQTWQELCRAAEEVAPNLVAGMRQGCFPVVSADPECTGRCPLRTVCRVSQIRALPRALEKHWSPGARLHAEAFAGAEAASSASAKEPE
jgi:RecB family exonuclease